MLNSTRISLYKNETLAIEAFKLYRLKSGVVCKKCGGTNHYWLAPKQQFQCKQCRFRTTLQSGTILEGSKLPLSYFFIALYLLGKYENRLSIDEFREFTGHKYNEPLYDFLRKIKLFLKTHDQHTILADFLANANKHEQLQVK